MSLPIWVTFISSILSGLITFFISTYFHLRQEERKQKLALFRGIMGTRHGIVKNADHETKREFYKYLNEAFAVFGKSPEVLKAIINFKIYPTRTSDNFTLLAREICKDLKIPDASIKDDFFNTPFIPNNL